jgi:hypothetical protein
MRRSRRASWLVARREPRRLPPAFFRLPDVRVHLQALRTAVPAADDVDDPAIRPRQRAVRLPERVLLLVVGTVLRIMV